MRKRTISIIFLLLISSVIIPIVPIFISTASKSGENQHEVISLKISERAEITTPITINDLPSSPTNWTWAEDQGYCTGSGTQSDPYIISELFFNSPSVAQNQLVIEDSRKYFIIRDCEFKGHTNFAGIQLFNTSNGVITENFMHPFTGVLVWLLNASYNVIQRNNASGGYFFGIMVEGATEGPGGSTRRNLISDNIITHNNDAGIFFVNYFVTHNTISDNLIINNTIGIELGTVANNNTITGNQIGNSLTIGLIINPLSRYNEIYENCFFLNELHAYDYGLNSSWDDGARGNYWDNYTGLDADNDGIGDIPYNITGASGSQDNFPLMSCPTLPTPPPEVPGYDAFLLLLFAGASSIVGIIFISSKKKIKFNNGVN